MRLLFGGNPLEFGDEIWRQKTRVLGLPDGEEIMPLAFFILTQNRRVTDRRTDTLRSLLPALASRRAGKKPFNENADEDLSAVVHFQCRIFKWLTFKLQNN